MKVYFKACLILNDGTTHYEDQILLAKNLCDSVLTSKYVRIKNQKYQESFFVFAFSWSLSSNKKNF